MIHAAENLRKDEIWIDALCIDQGNEPEKLRLIPKMGEIYSHADKVAALRDDDLNLLSGMLSDGVGGGGGGWRSIFKRVNLAGKERKCCQATETTVRP